MLNIETGKIVTSTLRVERNIDEDGVINELKQNIENYGIKIPLIVKEIDNDTYELVDGHRRLQVAIALDLKTVPCILTDEKTSLEVALSVNIHREDLTAVEIGKLLLSIYQNQKQIDNGFSYRKLTDLIHKSKAYISQHIGYAEKLSTDIQKDIIDNKRFIDKNILNRIINLDGDTQQKVYDEVLEKKLNRESVDKIIDELNKDEDDVVTDSDSTEIDTTNSSNDTQNENVAPTIIQMNINISSLNENDRSEFQKDFDELLEFYKLKRGV